MSGRIHFHSSSYRESINQCIHSLSPLIFAFAYRKEEIIIRIKKEEKEIRKSTIK